MLPRLGPDSLPPLSSEDDLALLLPRENLRLLPGDLEMSREALEDSGLSTIFVSEVLLVKSFLTFLINSGVWCLAVETVEGFSFSGR